MATDVLSIDSQEVGWQPQAGSHTFAQVSVEGA